MRLTVLVLAIAAHSVLAKSIYANGLAVGTGTYDVQSGAQLLYNGGTFAELIMATLLLSRSLRSPSARRRSMRRRRPA